jgi:hypothetical protein
MQPRQEDGPDRGRVYFLDRGDAHEIAGALRAEGYDVAGLPCDGPGRARWALEVSPDDDGLAAMVDVYGGWLPEEA